ncbi:hypothetical protein TSST111916_01105 [Tsukamurella strandjordii]|uniref:hypothetical protein n=1 Tax=Tsukamurella TaxID=2060 RepID=UPI001C7DE72D|nr:hypothetical protein [Tsukamurella sp. TY48]GIZ98954.1 hypothetical protein TTY48_35660 [Tsukamurella sp. TY48]
MIPLASAPARPSYVVPAVVSAVLGSAAGLIWGLTVPGIRGVVTNSGDVLVRQGQLDNFFIGTAAFVGISVVGGLLTAAALFRSPRRTPEWVAVTLAAAAFSVAIATVLGQAVADARFAGPGGAGLDYTSAPTIRLDGANFFEVANHPGGLVGVLASWVVVLVWPAITALWCGLAAAFARRLP